MHLFFNLLLVIWLNSLQITGNEEIKPTQPNNENQGIGENKSLLTASVYAKLFAERRKEQQLIIRKMMRSDNYEKNFKLLQIAYGKIFELMQEKNATLSAHAYNPVRNGFPQHSELQDAVTLVLENCCIAAESLLHFPEISYRIFSKPKFTEWKSILNWCNEFVNSMPHIIDESTVKLMAILMEEINEEQRSVNFENPYYANRKVQETMKPKAGYSVFKFHVKKCQNPYKINCRKLSVKFRSNNNMDFDNFSRETQNRIPSLRKNEKNSRKAHLWAQVKLSYK